MRRGGSGVANGDGFRVEVRGAREVLRALDALPRDATRAVKDGSEKLARQLANTVRAAGRADTRQSARAARTVRAARGTSPVVVAGPHPLLFGSEFGMTRRTGWYAKARYRDSLGRQFRPHLGKGSYWFFKTQDTARPEIAAAHAEMAAEVVRRWSA